MPGNKKTIIIKIIIKKKTAIFNLEKVNIKSLRDKKEIYGGI